jgi:uncharacterized protein YjbI with pentapeptide repeats
LDLSLRSLAFADFSNALLPHSKLINAKLQGANLESAQLQGTNLESTQLQGANLKSAQLQGANLAYVKLQGAYLESAQLQGAILRSAKLQGAYLGSAKLQGANLLFTKLYGAVLIQTQLKGKGVDIERLESSWTQDIDWQQEYYFTQLKTESWAQSEDVKFRLEQAQQWIKDFKSPQPALSSIEKGKFVKIWLELLCQDEYVTKGTDVTHTE